MNDETIASFKSWILLVVLFVVCVVFITPTFLIDNLSPIIEAIVDENQDNIFAIALQTFFAPLMVLAFNSGLLPLFIDFIAYLEGHKSKSHRQIGIMRKNFFFQSFNIIFLQLMGQTVILSAIKEISNQNVEDWQKMMGANLVNNNWFFLRYSIQLAFISNAIQLLDIPHNIVRGFKYMCYKRRQSRELEKKPFIDNFAYDLGFFQSHAIVIFALGLTFTGTNPIIGMFVTVFFTIKYWIEKYNLTFVYNREFEGGGVIKKQVLPFMIFNVYLFQVLNMGYFAIYSDWFFRAGVIFLIVQSLIMVVIYYHYNTKKQKSRLILAEMEEAHIPHKSD